MSPLFSDDQPIREVPVGELNRHTSAVLRMVDRGDRVIVTKHGRPLAVIVPVERALAVFVGSSETFMHSRLGTGEAPRG